MTQTPCDRGVLAAVVAYPGAGGGGLVLAGTVLGSSLAFIDGSAVNLTIPVIQQQLGGGAAGAQWVMNAYLLFLSALVLVGGAAGDRYGRKRVFVAGAILFTAASVCCGLSPNLTLLIAARAIQGIGAALLVPASLAILGASFDKQARGRAVGIWAGAGGLTSALGPVLGGWLTDAVSWRAVFLINVPLAALAVGFILMGAKESKADKAGPLDWRGALTVTLGLAAVTWGLTEAPERGLTGLPVAALVFGVLALAVFLRIEQTIASPMVPLQLFRSITFSGANGLTLLLYAAFSGALFLLPFELIGVHGYPAASAGAALLPLSAGLAVLSPLAGGFSAKVGPRVMLGGGPLLVATGFVLLALLADQSSYWAGVFPGLAIVAVGMGLAVAPLTDAVLGSVEDAHEGAAAGINNAVARVAGLLAVALVGFVLVGPPGAPAAGVIASGYRTAMIAAAALAGLAGVIGFLTGPARQVTAPTPRKRSISPDE
ncbi:MFS transporter [Phenylobacterium sp.]|uniref:MFS transporter n=1 Tax=Phenylobacterium sp. TaxID=1871053 RepID=UPI003BAAA747